MNGFGDGHATNNGKVVVVKFEGPPLRVDRGAKVLRDPGSRQAAAWTPSRRCSPVRTASFYTQQGVPLVAGAWTAAGVTARKPTVAPVSGSPRAAAPSTNRAVDALSITPPGAATDSIR
jgi:hypothetical protein